MPDGSEFVVYFRTEESGGKLASLESCVFCHIKLKWNDVT